jgi:hypothetical protein
MKTDITVSKKATINTGNYSSITPSISMTLKDVDIHKVDKIYEHLHIITSALFIYEFRAMSDIQDEVKKLGIKKFFDELKSDEMKEDLKLSIKELSDKLFEI